MEFNSDLIMVYIMGFILNGFFLSALIVVLYGFSEWFI